MKSNLIEILLVMASLFIFSGCTSTVISQSLASGALGCPSKEIIISDEDVNSGVHTFMATCNGKDYYCTYMYPNPISCKERSK